LKRNKKQGIEPDLIHNLFVLVILGAIIGSRIAYIFHSPAYYFSNPIEILKIWQGGLTIHGGIIGALIFALVYVIWIKKIPKKIIWKIADSVALIMPLSIAIGRIGCSLINDHQGAETSLSWGIIWPNGIIRHPVAEYLIIANLAIFFILWGLKSKFKKAGQFSFAFIFFFRLYSFCWHFFVR
jgi:phosphatidylglycerol:prolipoprotein diacylglycerol transferase